jgi:hypothetical protein
MATRSRSADPGSSPLEDRVVAFAEQVGWVIGTTKAKTSGWLDRTRLTDQLTRMRDGAAELLEHLQSDATAQNDGNEHRAAASAGSAATRSPETGRPTQKPASAPRSSRHSSRRHRPRGTAAKHARSASSTRAAAHDTGRAADPAHAPGKRHRAPMASKHGVKHSNEQIAKAKQASTARRRG